MSVVAFIRKMMDAGIPIEQALIAADIQEAMGPKPTARQERNRRYRENKRLKSSSEDAEDAKKTPEDVGSPPSSFSPRPPKPTTPAPRDVTTSRVKTPKRVASKRCPADWEPTEADTQVGFDEGFTAAQIQRELSKFRDTTFSTARSDWSATYRNWFRNSKTARQSNIVRMPDGRPLGTAQDAKRDQLEDTFRRRLAAAMDSTG